MARTKKQKRKRGKKRPPGAGKLRLLPGGRSAPEAPRCGLCGGQGSLTRTECCGNHICDDEHEYVLFSYARNSCSRNHRRFTLCGFHDCEGHAGDWKECEECRRSFDPETYAYFGTNEYNFEKLENPPEYEPTLCADCGTVIVLSEGGYSLGPDGAHCERCTAIRHPGLAEMEGRFRESVPPRAGETSPPRKRRRPKAASRTPPLDLPLGEPAELIVLSVGNRSARCREPGSGRELTWRCTDTWNLVPGETISIRPGKSWVFGNHPYLSGDVLDSRLDVAVLRLEPLALRPMGAWDPEEDYWREDGESVEDWEAAILASGPRPEFEMEQVIPGEDPDDPVDSRDPILLASEMLDAGLGKEAHDILTDLLAADLRCLDAHALLGNLAFEWNVDLALRHYAVGVGIGDLSLGSEFDGVLPWGMLDNRPFLRCLHGLALCLWRTDRLAEAGATLTRMLRLNPVDNQGARLILPDVRAGRDWMREDDLIW